MGIFRDAYGHLHVTPQSVVGSGRTSNSYNFLCMSSLPVSIKKIGTKATDKKWQHRFSHYKPMGDICCHGNQGPDPIWPTTLFSLSPNDASDKI